MYATTVATRAVKQLSSLIALIALLIINRSFNAHFVCYIFQFVCAPFAGRCCQSIAVE